MSTLAALRWSDKKAFLVIYGRQEDGAKYKWDLNFNKSCRGNKCVVPIEKIPGYPHLCHKKIWIGLDDNQCKNYGHGGYGGDYGHDYDKRGEKKDYDDGKKGGDHGDDGKNYGDDGMKGSDYYDHGGKKG
ncbi:hypothetical protein B0J15DRAFT_473318 [Fusarium solani]|uniref:Uncharacterized protein n=1 Tax=Fusarium solani TaxID=169388 RepID=A0A9P9JUP9_FUSSL|nr:uncharacterized protein B0J15DRAFT_473318 [Fusarium solani]KAH7228386.1 hypothetical protein B0J15DRAFT_473318 [Fusarium solani]